MFLAEEKKSPASLCFAALLSWPVDEALLRHYAILGYPFAQARMARLTEGNERFQFSKSAACQSEREGFYRLGVCYQDGDECKIDLEKAKACQLTAAQLGFVPSMTCFGKLLDESDPQRWFWLSRAAVVKDPSPFLQKNFFPSFFVQFRFWEWCCRVSDWQGIERTCQCRL